MSPVRAISNCHRIWGEILTKTIRCPPLAICCKGAIGGQSTTQTRTNNESHNSCYRLNDTVDQAPGARATTHHHSPDRKICCISRCSSTTAKDKPDMTDRGTVQWATYSRTNRTIGGRSYPKRIVFLACRLLQETPLHKPPATET